MKKYSLKHLVIAWGLFVSLMIPMILNGLHYAIFEHHEDEHNEGIAFQNPKSSHTLCSHPFVNEELSESSISISPSVRILDNYFSEETRLIQTVGFFSNHLRGPPNS